MFIRAQRLAASQSRKGAPPFKTWTGFTARTRDPSGDWLLNVWGSDGRLVNYLMAVGGYAEVPDSAADTRYGQILADGEHQALVSFGGMRGACR